MKRRRRKRFPIYRKVGYSFVAVYAVTAIVLVTFLIGLDMIPVSYLGVLGGVLAVLCLLFAVMQRGKVSSVIADILCLVIVAGSIAGCVYIDKMSNTIRNVAAAPEEQMETVEIGVYVLEEDPAQTLQDAADYKFGIVSADAQAEPEQTDSTETGEEPEQTDGTGTGQEPEQTDTAGTEAEAADAEASGEIDLAALVNGTDSSEGEKETEQAVADIEEELGKTLDTGAYGNVSSLLDGLKEGTVGAIVANSANIGIVGDETNYSWVNDGLRQIALFTYETGRTITQVAADIPEEGSNSFIMYLSGIDTYGGTSTVSRSDVNILAVVNTETKNILLLSTPRDYYIGYSATGGAKDKLTHAGIYGIDASIDALEQLYGIDVNYYLRVNFTGFTQIIDALGGVDVHSDYEFTARGTQIYQGSNHLTGEEALNFARERYSFEDGDFQRGRNQMEVVRAVIQKAASSSLLANYMSVMNAVAGSFETNMPQEEIAKLVKMQLSDMASWNITSYTASGQVSSAETYSMPGVMLSVVLPDESSVAEAKSMISDVTGE